MGRPLPAPHSVSPLPFWWFIRRSPPAGAGLKISVDLFHSFDVFSFWLLPTILTIFFEMGVGLQTLMVLALASCGLSLPLVKHNPEKFVVAK